MLALLPLHGWAGDAMAMEMATAALHNSAAALDSQAHHAHSAGADAPPHAQQAIMHDDCPDHAAAQGVATDSQAQASADGDTCTACQICHAVALTAAFPQLAPSALPAAQPHTATHHFASAERATGFKPPIF